MNGTSIYNKPSVKKKNKGIHSKKRSSNTKTNKHYKKRYIGQGK